MKRFSKHAILGTLGSALLLVAAQHASANTIVLDFEVDDGGVPLVAGATGAITNQFQGLGVVFSEGSGRDLNLFQSTCTTGGGGTCTGNDDDLSLGLGNILIIQEDGVALTDPNDRAGGGTIIATFTNPVFLDQIGFGDLETDGNLNVLSDQEARVRAFDAAVGGNQIGLDVIVGNGNGLSSTEIFNYVGVHRLEIELNGSGSVTSITFTVPAPGTLALVGLGLLGMGIGRRRRR